MIRYVATFFFGRYSFGRMRVEKKSFAPLWHRPLAELSVFRIPVFVGTEKSRETDRHLLYTIRCIIYTIIRKYRWVR